MAVYSEIRTEHTNALCGPNAELLNVKHCGTYSNHQARAGEPLARVKISLARGIHCCPIFILVLPVHLLYIGKNVCVRVRARVRARVFIYTGCPRRNVPDFGREFLMLRYTDITQNTYIQS